MNAFRNPYKVLGVHRGSTDAEIKAEYYRLSGALHPDKAPAGASADPFIEVSNAYHDIRSESKRNALNELMRFTADPCQDCSTNGCYKVRRKGGTEVRICPHCDGCGWRPRAKKQR